MNSIDPAVKQVGLNGVRPGGITVRERSGDSGTTETTPSDGITLTQAGATSEAPPTTSAPALPTADNGVGERVATSLIPGGPAFNTLPTTPWPAGWESPPRNSTEAGAPDSTPFYSPDKGTMNFFGGSGNDELIMAHEYGHGLPDGTMPRDATRLMFGGMGGAMLGGILGGYGDATDVEAAMEKMRLAGDAMQRLQSLEGGYTAAHMQRAGALAGNLADALAGTPQAVSINERFALAHASMIYDVGKLEVDEKLLTKPGKLTDDERLAVNKHVEPSEELLGLFNPSAETRAIIKHHHERWDGKGFPSGLAGNDIPMPARMVAIADSWDAMTCDRPFRPAMSYDKARGIIESGAGTQYDPELVKVFFDKVVPRPS